jgi:hypothetical protein
VSAHRVGAGEHAVEQHANAVHVALNRGFAAAKELWCEIQGRAGERARRGGRLAHLPTGAEVHQNGSPVGREHHILRLDVAVQKAGAVDSRNGVANLGADLKDLGRLEWWPLREPLFDCLAVDQFHPETNGVPDALGAIDRDDVGVADAREEPTFLDDGGRARIFGIGSRGLELQRNFAIETRVPCTVDVPECTGAKWLQDTDVPPCLRWTRRFRALLPMKVGERRQEV